ncbi:MAG: hypothetical protein ACK55I_24970, partial [bacterium]
QPRDGPAEPIPRPSASGPSGRKRSTAASLRPGAKFFRRVCRAQGGNDRSFDPPDGRPELLEQTLKRGR